MNGGSEAKDTSSASSLTPVELKGIEPSTSGLQSPRSPD